MYMMFPTGVYDVPEFSYHLYMMFPNLVFFCGRSNRCFLREMGIYEGIFRKSIFSDALSQLHLRATQSERDIPTNRPTNRSTDTPSYRDA